VLLKARPSRAPERRKSLRYRIAKIHNVRVVLTRHL
jgi:hypothetical protein